MWLKCKKDHFFNPKPEDISLFKNQMPPVGFKMLSEGKLYKLVRGSKYLSDCIFVITDWDQTPRLFSKDLFEIIPMDEFRDKQIDVIIS